MLSAIVGEHGAATKLVRMTRAQEGFFGGYYSGICTLVEGTFRVKKDVGPVRSLDPASLVANLRGGAGLAHSRTRSGGGSNRAQPYVDTHGCVAGIGTGTHGCFASTHQNQRQFLTQELEKEGVQFSSAAHGISGSATLLNGMSIHNTELVVQAVGRMVALGLSPTEAIREVVRQIPAEGAYIFLFRDYPGELYIANYNQRLLSVKTSHTFLVVSSTLGLTDDERGNAQEAPPNSLTIGRVGRAECVTLDDPHAVLLDRSIPATLEANFLDYVAQKPDQTWSTIVEQALLPLFPHNKATMVAPLSFGLAERLIEEGKVTLQVGTVYDEMQQAEIPQAVFRIGNHGAYR